MGRLLKDRSARDIRMNLWLLGHGTHAEKLVLL